MADGYVATFKVKFDLLFWRPVTAIRLADTDGNALTAADPGWKPLREVPPIPDHDSGHAMKGGAAAAALRGYSGPTGSASPSAATPSRKTRARTTHR